MLFVFFPKHFSVRGLLNCEHEPRGRTCWKSADFRAERREQNIAYSSNNLIPTSKQALKSFCLRIWARRVGSSQPALGGFGPGE